MGQRGFVDSGGFESYGVSGAHGARIFREANNVSG